MSSPLRIAVALLGAFFTIQGLGWLVDPARAATSLGMPYLEGIGRSTQVGDFASFFLCAGIAMLLGARPGRSSALWFPAALVGGAALTRTLAWLLHGADFAWLFVAVEVATAAVLVRAARTLDVLP